jgi:hypothetical protein
LWPIDSAAYGEASITYERFKDWWSSFPLGLRALFFRNRVMGAIGIWPLSIRLAASLKSARLKGSELSGRMMRTFVDNPSRSWYGSGIVLRPNSWVHVQSKYLCPKASASGSSVQKSSSLANCLPLPTQPKVKPCWRDSISSVSRMQPAMPDHVPLFAGGRSNRSDVELRSTIIRAEMSERFTDCSQAGIIRQVSKLSLPGQRRPNKITGG